MTEKKNFSNQDTPSIIDTEYRACNFRHDEPVFAAGQWKGHRLFPGDDTPRTFIGCNLINCEPPPGSTVIRGNTAIIQHDIVDAVSDDIVIDGQSIAIEHRKKVVHGKWTVAGYEYKPTPKEYLFEREV